MNWDDVAVAAELRPALRALLEQTQGAPPLNGANLGYYRKRAKFNVPQPLNDVPCRIVEIAGGTAYRGCRLWIINQSQSDEVKPAILHFHGGGLVMGSCQNALPRMQRLAQALNCVVVSVEYGLAPEVKANESLRQNIAVLEWVMAEADSLNIDARRIAILGVSAGGCHGVNLATQWHVKRRTPLAGLALLYPMLDDSTGTTLKPSEPVGKYLWTAAQNRYGWQAFLGKEPGSHNIPAEYVPARAASVAGLPPTYIGVGELDLFYRENCILAEKLIAAGVNTELHTVPGAFHAFESVAPGTTLAKVFNERLYAALSAMLML